MRPRELRDTATFDAIHDPCIFDEGNYIIISPTVEASSKAVLVN